MWGQWGSDTQGLLSGLTQALAPAQPTTPPLQPLLLTFERWILLLKVSLGVVVVVGWWCLDGGGGGGN